MYFDKVWFNGDIKNRDEVDVSPLSHSLHYGSGVFEGIRAYSTSEGPAVFRLEDHIDRFFFSAKKLNYEIGFTKQEIIDGIKKILQENDVDQCYIRPLVFYGEKIGLVPGSNTEVNVLLAAIDMGKYLGSGKTKVKISDYIRLHPQTTETKAKLSGNYINSLLASQQAKRGGFDEALLLDYEGNIAEGSAQNIFFVKDDKVFTPDSNSILPGITRDTVLEICKNLEIETHLTNINSRDLEDFEEAFFVGTATEVNAINSIEDTEFDVEQNEITQRISKDYKEIVRGQKDKYNEWLTIVN